MAVLFLNSSKLETNQMSISRMDKDIMHEFHSVMLFNHRMNKVQLYLTGNEFCGKSISEKP